MAKINNFKITKKNAYRPIIIIIGVISILVLIFLIYPYLVKDVRYSAIGCNQDNECSDMKDEKYCVENQCEECKVDDNCKSALFPVCIKNVIEGESEYDCKSCRDDSDCKKIAEEYPDIVQELYCTPSNTCNCRNNNECFGERYSCYKINGESNLDYGTCEDETITPCEERFHIDENGNKWIFECVAPKIGTNSDQEVCKNNGYESVGDGMCPKKRTFLPRTSTRRVCCAKPPNI